MRCFVPATDDEIYALIERYGFSALVAYRCGMHLAKRSDAPVPTQPNLLAERRFWNELEEAPRQAA